MKVKRLEKVQRVADEFYIHDEEEIIKGQTEKNDMGYSQYNAFEMQQQQVELMGTSLNSPLVEKKIVQRSDRLNSLYLPEQLVLAEDLRWSL